MHYYEAEAFLFDMDGTLIDSRQQIEYVWSAWCQRTGLPLQEVLHHAHGIRTLDTLHRVAPHLDVAEEVAWIEAVDASGSNFQPLPNAQAFLRQLPPAQWAIVTSAPAPLLESRFEVCELPLPAVRVTAETVTQGKPSPAPYLKAAELLGLPPQACIVFEDSAAGLDSALAAGCRVVLIGGLKSDRHGVLACIEDYTQLELLSCNGLLLGVPERASRKQQNKSYSLT